MLSIDEKVHSFVKKTTTMCTPVSKKTTKRLKGHIRVIPRRKFVRKATPVVRMREEVNIHESRGKTVRLGNLAAREAWGQWHPK